jgi:hypothetical protein
MDDRGRPFTDFRSSQVREELFKQKYNLTTENEARTFRIENAEDLADDDWARFSTTYACPPRKNYFHVAPTTLVTTEYNNAELLAYNGLIPPPAPLSRCNDYRLTCRSSQTMPSKLPPPQPRPQSMPPNMIPVRDSRTGRLMPEKLYDH